MKLDNILKPIEKIEGTWNTRVFSLAEGEALDCVWRFEIDWDEARWDNPDHVRFDLVEDGKWRVEADFSGFKACATYLLGPEGKWVDETVTLEFARPNPRLSDLSVGTELDIANLHGFRATPIPFRVSLKGNLQEIDLVDACVGAHFAEGWVVENGTAGFLVMRVPSGSAYTCFVPLVIRLEGGRRTIQVGSLGPDGEGHRERSPFLDTPWQSSRIEFPTTRFIFFKGDWRTGFEIFRQMVSSTISRLGGQAACVPGQQGSRAPHEHSEPRRRPCPISYNTYHDFGPKYDRTKLIELMPMLADMGFGLLHLDPGWETVWGSNQWGEEHMGDLESFVAEAKKHGLEVGCWTSVHSTDPEVHDDNYTRNQREEKFYAEDFAQFDPTWNRLWGTCPASNWQDDALAKLSRLGKAGFRFLNSDFHDWPWNGEGCWYDKHWHSGPLTRAQWCEALNELYVRLHRECPEMVIELHDHVESGDYRTPVWYLYDLPDSYDEKWAYEFMWKTFDDLMAHRLFSLYYVRLAEPIPLFLHMNASTDNEHAIAFWYVASCVTHIGVGGILKSTEKQRQAYRRAFAQYNARFEAFTQGAFYAIDELTHVHVYPDRRRAVILAFNLDDHPVERQFALTPETWDMPSGIPRLEGAELMTRGSELLAKTDVPAKGVAIVDLFL